MPDRACPIRQRLLLSLFAALAAPLTGQIYVVDVQGGAGAQFTSITAAVAAVPDGAVLRVRPGQYLESVVVTGKALTITGAPTALIVAPPGAPALHVSGLSASQTFVVHDIQVGGTLITDTAEVVLANNLGLVFVDLMNAPGFRRLNASHCDALLLARSSFQATTPPGAQLDASTVVVDDCSFVELRTTASDVQLAGSTVIGVSNVAAPGGAAMTMQGGTLRLLTSQVSGGFSQVTAGFAIDGTGSVRLTPDTSVSGAPGLFGPGISVATQAMPRTATSWITGNFYSAYATGPAGDLGVLVMSVPTLPQTLPGLDAIWLHDVTAQVVAAGVFGSGNVAAMTMLPSSPTFAGLSIAWQAFAFAPNGVLTASNPTWRVLS